jgi:uncharacterized protein
LSERYSGAVGRRAPVVLVCGLVATAALTAGLTRLTFRSSNDTLVSTGSQVYKDDLRYERAFGGQVMLVLYAGDARQLLLDPANRAALDDLERRVSALPHIHAVITPLDAVRYEMADLRVAPALSVAALSRDQEAAARAALAAGRSPDQARRDVAAAFAARTADDSTRLAAAGPQTLDNPRFVDFLLFDGGGRIRTSLRGVFPDARHGLVAVRVAGAIPAADSDDAAASVTSVARSVHVRGMGTTVTGSAALLREVDVGMRSGLVRTGALALVVMAGILLLVSRSRWRLLPLPVVLAGIVWTFSALGVLRLPMTMVTIAGLPILIGLGVDFAVQFHSRYEQETSLGAGALTRAFAGIGPALVIAMVAAIVGFLALRLSSVPMIRQFGIVLALGTALLLVVVLLLLPAVLATRDRRSVRPLAERTGRLERVVGVLTAGRGHAVAVVAAVGAIAVFGTVAMHRTSVQTDPERFVPQGSAVVRGLDQVRAAGGGSGDIGFLVEGEVMRPDVLAWMAAYERKELARHPDDLLLSASVASTVAQLTGSDPVPTDVQTLLALAPTGIRRAMVSDDRANYQMDFAVGHLTLGEQKRLLAAMKADLHPPAGIRVVPAGLSVVGIAAVDAMRTGQLVMAFAGLLAVFTWLLVRFRSPRRAAMAVIPVVAAVGLSSTVVYLAGVQVSALGALSSPIVVAIGTEFAVLVLERYAEERRRGLSPGVAVGVAGRRIGRAFLTSGLTTAGGFAVLALSGFPLLASFGALVGIDVLVTVACALVILPPLLVASDRAVVPAPEPVPTTLAS